MICVAKYISCSALHSEISLEGRGEKPYPGYLAEIISIVSYKYRLALIIMIEIPLSALTLSPRPSDILHVTSACDDDDGKEHKHSTGCPAFTTPGQARLTLDGGSGIKRN